VGRRRESWSSRLEAFEEPVRPDHVGSQCLGPSTQLAIRRDERDLLTRRTTGDVNEHVVAAGDGVPDRDADGPRSQAGRSVPR